MNAATDRSERKVLFFLDNGRAVMIYESEAAELRAERSGKDTKDRRAKAGDAITRDNRGAAKFSRAATLGKVRRKSRSVAAILSTAAPITMPWGDQVLEHSPAAVNLERAAEGLPLLVSHDRGSLPIGIVRDVRLDGAVLRGELQFSEATDPAREAWALVDDGTVRSISIGGQIDRVEQDDDGTERITRWTPTEASIVAVPADHGAGIGRDDDEPTIPDRIAQLRGAGAGAGAGADTGEAEHQRVVALNRAADQVIGLLPDQGDAVREIRDRCIGDRTVTAERGMGYLMDLLGGGAPLAGGAAGEPGRGTIEPGDDVTERFAAGAVDAILMRAGVGTFTEEQRGANPYGSWSMVELARESLRVRGVRVSGLDRMEIVGRAFTRAIDPGTAANDTTTYPSILATTMRKVLFTGFDESPRTWDQWTSQGSTQDFKAFTRPGLSHFQDLALVAEGAEFQEGVQIDKHEGAALGTYGRKYSITRQAVINDDLGAFTTQGRRMGEAAQRLLDTLPYALLLSNPTMTEDATALFIAGHNNLFTAALSETSIDQNATAMGRQVDQNSIPLGIPLTYILVPLELRGVARRLEQAEKLPTGDGSEQDNLVRGTFTSIPTHQLTDVNDWYSLGPKGGTVEMVGLNGSLSPALESDVGWSVDSLHWKVRIDAVALALDFRAMIHNAVV